MMSSIFRRVISQKIGNPRKLFCSGAVVELVERAAPCLLMPPCFGGSEKGEMVYKLYSYLNEKTVSFHNRGGKEEADLMGDSATAWVGTSHGWLAAVNHRNDELFLLNPISGRVIHLPPYRGKPFRENEDEDGRFPLKLILSHSPDEEECHAVIVLASMDRAAFCRPGRTTQWAPLGRWYKQNPDTPRRLIYGDVAYSPARNVLVSCVRDVADRYRRDIVMFRTPPGMRLVKTVVTPETGPGRDWSPFLVFDDDSSRLYLVRRYVVDRNSVDYQVFSISDDGVESCSSLDGLVFFVGNNHSLVAKAAEFPHLKSDSIYFSSEFWLFPHQYMDIFEYPSKSYTHMSPELHTGFHSVPPLFIPSLD